MGVENSPHKVEDAAVRRHILIVGAGVAGASLAHALASRSVHVTLIERDLSMPDRVVGEFLQPGGVFALQQLGLADCVEGIDAPFLQGYAVFLNQESVPVRYPQVAGKPAAGRAFHHGRFVQNLREKCKSVPEYITMIEGTVTKLLEDSSGRVRGVQYKHAGSDEVFEALAPLTVVCDGPGSTFRKVISPVAKPCVKSHFVAVLLHGANKSLPYPNHGHVILSDKMNPVLVYPIAEQADDCRMLIDISGPLPNAATGEMQEFLLSHILPELPPSIQPFFRTSVECERIRSMPNRVMPGKSYAVRGALLLGDAFNCRHPLTGGGMTVALSDVVLLKDLLADAADALSDDRRIAEVLHAFYQQRKPLANSINILASALYAVFAAKDDPAVPAIRQACFEYFKAGGDCVAGPMGLLGGLTPSVSLLLYHFSKVALVGIRQTLWSSSFRPSAVWQSLSMARAASGIIVPLVWEFR